MNRTIDWYLKWVATAVICAGSFCTSVNIYPLAPILMNLGTILWLIVAVMWREASLIVVNTIVLLIYTVGLTYKFVWAG
jgi:hypothetical protein